MVGLVDEWAARFFEELDYVKEGENGMIFSEMMRKDLPQVTLLILVLYPKFFFFFFFCPEVTKCYFKTMIVKVYFSRN